MNHRINKATAVYSVIQAAYWMSFCVIFAFSSVYLLGVGFGNTEIGILVAVSGTVSAVLQPVIGGMIDRSRRLTLKKAVLMLGGLMAALACVLLLCPENKGLTAFIYGLLITLLQTLTPLVYAMGMEWLNQGIPLDFGLARGMGSLAFAAASQAAGVLTAALGVYVIPVMIGTVYAVFLIAVCLFRKKDGAFSGKKECGREENQGEVRSAERQKTGKREKEKGFFRRYHRYLFLLLGVTLVFVSHNMLSNFSYQVMEYKGGTSASMGTALAIAAVCELPTMFLFGFMVKKVESSVWLKVSGLFFALKAVGTLLAGSVAVMYLVQVFQMFGFGLYVVSSVYYVNQIMEPEDRVKGQSYMTMTNTLGSVFASLAGGALIDGAGVAAFLLVSAAAALLGMGIIGWSAESVKKSHASIDE